MRMNETIELHASVNSGKPAHPLFSVHDNNVASITKKIKDNGDMIQMVETASPLKGNNAASGWKTVIYHGLTRSASKKTVVQTNPDGSMKSWLESMT